MSAAEVVRQHVELLRLSERLIRSTGTAWLLER
jgi:hypothetical protein